MKKIVILVSFLISIYWAQEGAQYLIIAYDNFYDQIAPLALWKNQKGIKTVVKHLSEVGSTPNQIRSYITNAYNTWSPRPEFLLLVGSPNLLPAYTYQSDNQYADMSGDYRAELACGRFPCKNARQCSVMVKKTMSYEQAPFMADTFWMKSLLTIVRDGDNSDDTIYYNDVHFARDLVLNNGFYRVDSLTKDHGDDQDDIINSINSGRGFVLYRGTAGSNWWYPFYVDPCQATNCNKLPVIISATCATVTLAPGESMVGEAWLKAGNTQTLKGAVAFFGNARSDNDVAHLRSAIARGYFKGVFLESLPTMGQAMLRAKKELYDLYAHQQEYQSFTLLGDPELNLWTATPKMLSVSYDTVLPQLPGQFSITVLTSGATVPNARVCIWKANDFYLTGNTDSLGFASFDINPQTEGGFLVTVTGRNCYPFQDSAWILNGDVGVVAINNIPTSIDSGTVIVPSALVKNFGTTTASFSVRFAADSYTSTRLVSNLLPESTYSVEFDSLFFVRRGENIYQCSTELVGDENFVNDWVIDTTFINVYDVGVTQIISPLDTLWVGDTTLPESDIHNFGNNPESFSIRFWIRADSGDVRIVYDSVLSIALEPDQDTVVSFPEWVVNESGDYSAICQTELINDMNPENDSLAKSIFVIPQSGATEINPANEIFGLQCYPNPFLNNFTIKYGPVKNKEYWLKIYDVTGELVRAIHLALNENQTTVVWDGKNSLGREVNQGIYFMQLEEPAIRFKKKLLKLSITSRGNVGGLKRGGVR
jgi:Peptidase family C25/Secretion system C-terminal sorting domain